MVRSSSREWPVLVLELLAWAVLERSEIMLRAVLESIVDVEIHTERRDTGSQTGWCGSSPVSG